MGKWSFEAELWIIDDSLGGAVGRPLKENKKRAVHLSVAQRPMIEEDVRILKCKVISHLVIKTILMIINNH